MTYVQNLENSRRDRTMFQTKKAAKMMAIMSLSCGIFSINGFEMVSAKAYESDKNQKLIENFDSSEFRISEEGELLGYKGDGKEVVIPEGVKKIAFGVFLDRDNIEKVVLPESLEDVGEYVFFGCASLKEVEIPNKVKKIGRLAFGDCKSCRSIRLGSGIKAIEEFAFDGCSGLEEITVNAANQKFSSKDGILYDKDQKIVKMCPANKKGEVTLPETVEVISEYAFAGCKDIEKVCGGGNKPLKLEDAAFYKCENLTNIDVKAGFSKIGSCVFAECKSLKEFTVGENVSKLGSLAFMKCEALRKVTFLSNKTSLGKNVFASCPQTILISAEEDSEIGKYAKKHFSKFILA